MNANERIKFLRETLHLSQEQFGNSIGLTKSGISNIENGARNVTEKHIKLISVAHKVSETWLRNGIGELFLKTDDSLLEKLTAEYSLSESEKKVIATYLKLDEKKRSQLVDFVKCFTVELLNSNSEISATVAVRPAVSDDMLNRETAHKILDKQFDVMEKTKTSLDFTGINGL